MRHLLFLVFSVVSVGSVVNAMGNGNLTSFGAGGRKERQLD